MDWRVAVGRLGRALIASGVLILLFVAYQLWGTGLAEARSQRSLRESFRSQPVTTSTTAAPSPTTTAPVGPPPPPTGEALAIIRIPRIGVDKAVVQGVSLPDLKKGPGHYPNTPMPGQPGNAAIAGHRTTYGAPFFNLNELQPGDPIFVTTRQGKFRYEVRETRTVSPSELSVLSPTPDNRLTLTTCNPRFSASQRLVVVSQLIGEAAEPSPPPTDLVDAGRVSRPTIDTAGLSGGRSPRLPAILWGLLAALVWLATRTASKRWRKWPAYFAGTPVFLVVLFVFFENFSRLLPANF
jgi:sortase A